MVFLKILDISQTREISKRLLMALPSSTCNTWLQHLGPPPQLEQPCAKHDQYILRDFPLPELLYAIYQLLLVAWLDFSFQVELEFMPQVFDWVEVRTLWRSTPPVNVFLLKESLCPPGHVFGIIVLHEPVVGKFVSDKWDERRL